MGVTQKTLFAENLDRYQTFVTDTDPNSKYFKITELSDTFTGGKNAFLIAGSEYLVPDTLIKIEIKDSEGNTIYHEPGEGIVSSSVNGEWFVSEYYEGVSKVVSVHIYPDTSYGPATITILGEVSKYDNNGVESPIPSEWENKYNVKWQKQINVNPSLANTTKIRFYQRPKATISEIIQPIYQITSGSKVSTGINQSFANIKLSQLQTFAGDVKRIKVFRTSQGDISDYDLIQDIYVEAKELLTTYNLSGSVVGNAGIFTSEVLEKQWNSGSLLATQNTSRIESGVRLVGTGSFTYTSSLDFKSGNTYELNLDAFFSGNLAQDLGVWISSGSASSSIATLSGIVPTKNLLDSTYQFKLDSDYISSSLYFSQSYSAGEWHIGNVSLKLTQDTAFSPDEISFVTTMPTIVGNETYNFKFECYDVNNNYVPVYVTQSATFDGGTTLQSLAGTIDSSSLATSASLYAVSQSISGTAALYFTSSISTSLYTSSLYTNQVSASLTASISSSISSSFGYTSGSIYTLSGSVSASLTSLSSSVSSSNANVLSSSLSKVQNLADGQYSGSFISGNIVYAPVIGGQTGYFSQKFQVGSTNPIVLDASTSTRKIYVGTGNYNNTNTSIYMDSDGQFSLKDQLLWNGSALTVNGTINVTGGNAATQTYANTIGTNSVLSGSASATAAQTAAQLFATSVGNNAVLSGSASATAAQAAAIAQAKTDASASINLLANGNWTAGSGTFITSNSISSPIIAGNGGYISSIFKVGSNGITLDGTNKKIYVGTGTYASTNTPFYFASGSTDIFSLGNKLTWDGTTLGITGNVVITGGTTKDAIDAAASAASTAQTTADSKITGAQVNANVTSISGGAITTGTVSANRIDVAGVISAGSIIVSGDSLASLSNASTGYQNATNVNNAGKTAGSVGGWSIDANSIRGNSPTGGGDGVYTTNAGIILSSAGWISSKNFYIDSSGNAAFRGNITATGGSFTGDVTAGGVTINGTGITFGGVTINGTGITMSGGTSLAIDGSLNMSSTYGFITSLQQYSAFTSRLRLYANNTSEGGHTHSLTFDSINAGTGTTMVIDTSGYVKKSSSSKRYKKNIKDLPLEDAKKIYDLNVITFNDLEDADDNEHTGFIAEDVDELGLRDWVIYDKEGVVDGVWYQSIFSSMVKVVQDLNKRVEELEAKLSGSI